MGNEIVSYNPSTGEILGKVASVSQEELSMAVERAQNAQKRWETLSPKERAETLKSVQSALVEGAEEIARLIALEQGKTLAEAYAMEIFPALEALDFAVKRGWKMVSPQKVRPWTPVFTSHAMEIRYEPLGVVGIIPPWNYPFAIPFIEVVSALIAGNGVVFKPSPYTPLVGDKVAELFQKSGLPEGLVQTVHGEGDVGNWLVTHTAVDGVLFTGSVATGRKVYEAAVPSLKKVVLELGGKDPAIVLADADLEYTAQGILWAAMANAGQTCAAVEVAFVHHSVFQSFLQLLTEKANGLRVGDPLSDVEMGPISNEPQYHKVLSQLEEARTSGTEVVGGEPLDGKGYFIRPAVVVDPPQHLKVLKEETFGPVIAVVPFKEEDEAIARANSMPYGLTASVWTTDPSAGERLAKALRYGVVTVNDHLFTFAEPQLPWGGFRESGLGRSHGLPGLMELVEPKGVAKIHRYLPRLWWYPSDRGLMGIMKGSMEGFFSPSLISRWKGLMLLPLNRRVRERVCLKDFMVKGAMRVARALLGR